MLPGLIIRDAVAYFRSRDRVEIARQQKPADARFQPKGWVKLTASRSHQQSKIAKYVCESYTLAIIPAGDSFRRIAPAEKTELYVRPVIRPTLRGDLDEESSPGGGDGKGGFGVEGGAEHRNALLEGGAPVVLMGKHLRQDKHNFIDFGQGGTGEGEVGNREWIESTRQDAKA